jgi:hypothetical protein
VPAGHRTPDRVAIWEIMSKPLMYEPPEMDIDSCPRLFGLFGRFGLSRAPVVEHGEVIGGRSGS